MSTKHRHTTKKNHTFEWLQKEDPEFASAVRQLCLEDMLKTGTFMYPEKEYRDTITNLAYEDDNKASAKVKSLMIPFTLHDAQDFREESDNLGNAAGAKLRLNKAQRKGEVDFEGFKLLKVSSFKAPDAAVWRLRGGHPPVTGDYVPSARKHHGGAEMHRPHNNADRKGIAQSVELKFATYHQAGSRRDQEDPYLRSVTCFLNYLKENSEDSYNLVQPLLDYDPAVSFYLLLEPYKVKGDYLLNDDDLKGFESAIIVKDLRTDFLDHFKNFDNGVISSSRMKLMRACEGDARSAPKVVNDAYTKFDAENKFGDDDTPVLPQATYEAVKNGKKMWQDEFRYVMHNAFKQIRFASTMDFKSDFDELKRMLEHDMCGNDYKHELSVLDINKIKASLRPRDDICDVIKFANEMYFMYVPISHDVAAAIWGGGRHGHADNPFKSKVSYIKSVGSKSHSHGISDGAYAELKSYYKRHGSLPSFD